MFGLTVWDGSKIQGPRDFLEKIKDIRPGLYNDLHLCHISESSEVLRKHGFDVKPTDYVIDSLNKCWDIICKEDTVCLK